MPPVSKKKAKRIETLRLRVGNKVLIVNPFSEEEVEKANARIQKRVQPVFYQIKKTRRAAAITASKIILNA